MKYQTILFDLDGTIIDNSEGITASVAYSLDFFGNKYDSVKSLESFIGPPLKEQFMNFCGVNSDKGEEYVKKYREYYSVKGIYQNRPYEGISHLLKTLKNSGKTIILATSKPEKFAITILKQNNLFELFDFTAGALMNNTRTKKSEVIQYALDAIGGHCLKSTVMVGDRAYDVEGAKEIGIDTIGVTYGFGTENELLSAGACRIAKNADELLKILSE